MVSPAGLPGLSAGAALPWWQRRVLRCNRSGAAALLLLLALSGLLLNATLPFWLGMGGVEALHRQLLELEGRGSHAELQAAFHVALQAAGVAPSAGGAAFGSHVDSRSAPRADAVNLHSLSHQVHIHCVQSKCVGYAESAKHTIARAS